MTENEKEMMNSIFAKIAELDPDQDHDQQLRKEQAPSPAGKKAVFPGASADADLYLLF